MTQHVAYEVRVQRQHNWRVEGIFDDEVLALAAARQVEVAAGRSAVVVIKEIYDGARNHMKSSSIYRSGEVAAVVRQPKATEPVAGSPRLHMRWAVIGIATTLAILGINFLK